MRTLNVIDIGLLTDHLVGSLFGISPEEADITTPNIRRVYARLLPAIGDTPQAKPLSDLNRQTGSPSGQHSNISTSLRTTSGLDRLVDAAVAALKTESPLQSSDSGSEEDTPRPSLSIAGTSCLKSNSSALPDDCWKSQLVTPLVPPMTT